MSHRIALLAASLIFSSSAVAQPNVLLVIGDDIGVDVIRAYGEHPEPALTPTIDTIADNGVLFRNAWAHPLCSPARASIYTGRHAFRHGVLHPGGAALPTSEQTLPELLSAEGYATALFGKWHLGRGQTGWPSDHGFQTFAGSLSNIDDYFEWDKATESGGARGTQATSNTYATLANVTDLRAWLLQQSGPWMATLAFNAGHSPMHVPPDFLLSSTTQQSLAGNPGDLCDGTGPDRAEDCYRAMVEAADTALGYLIRWMYSTGRLTNTLVIFVGDNGTPGNAVIRHDAFTRNHAKGTVYEGGVNVPLVIAGGPALNLLAGEENEELVQAMDIFRTVLDAAGASAASTEVVDGNSLYGMIDGSGTSGHPIVYSELFTDQAGAEQDLWTVSDGATKFMSLDGIRQCFDLVTDGRERQNLYDDPNADTSVCDALEAARPCETDPTAVCP